MADNSISWKNQFSLYEVGQRKKEWNQQFFSTSKPKDGNEVINCPNKTVGDSSHSQGLHVGTVQRNNEYDPILGNTDRKLSTGSGSKTVITTKSDDPNQGCSCFCAMWCYRKY